MAVLLDKQTQACVQMGIDVVCPRHNASCCLTALLCLNTSDGVRLSEASIIGLFVWQTCIPNTNQANGICAFGPKAQIRVARFAFGLHVCRIYGQRYVVYEISSMKDVFIRKLNIVNIVVISLRSVHRDAEKCIKIPWYCLFLQLDVIPESKSNPPTHPYNCCR